MLIVFWTIVTIVLVTLKLTDQIDWSWFWVLFPLLMDLIIVVLVGIFIAFHASITGGK